MKKTKKATRSQKSWVVIGGTQMWKEETKMKSLSNWAVWLVLVDGVPSCLDRESRRILLRDLHLPVTTFCSYPSIPYLSLLPPSLFVVYSFAFSILLFLLFFLNTSKYFFKIVIFRVSLNELCVYMYLV